MTLAEIVQRAIEVLPVLARFAIMMALIVIVPRLSRRVHLPGAVGLLLSGVVLGPHMLDVFPRQHPVAEFFSELGMLLLMFFAGLEINLTLFREKIVRSIVFGVVTTTIPLLLGSFMAGLAVNAAVKDKPATNKLEFMGNTLFIPGFFVVTGFLIDPMALMRSLTQDYFLATGIIGALLVGKWIASESCGRAFGYSSAARKTMWSLTLPQVAATLAATLVAYRTFNAAGQPLLDSRMLNGVLIMVLVTSILGPVLTQRFAPHMLDATQDAASSEARST